MKTLVVEDDPGSSLLLVELLKQYGPVDPAKNGVEAVKLFAKSFETSEHYDLVCMDIMMPEMDGQQALREIREIEKKHGIEGLDAARIIMTTALGDSGNIMLSFREQCDGYLVKPIDKQKLTDLLQKLELA